MAKQSKIEWLNELARKAEKKDSTQERILLLKEKRNFISKIFESEIKKLNSQIQKLENKQNNLTV